MRQLLEFVLLLIYKQICTYVTKQEILIIFCSYNVDWTRNPGNCYLECGKLNHLYSLISTNKIENLRFINNLAVKLV